jgi:hypothetical protein
MSYQFSFFLSPTMISAAGYSFQRTVTSASGTSGFSFSVSTTISDLIISKFIP